MTGPKSMVLWTLGFIACAEESLDGADVAGSHCDEAAKERVPMPKLVAHWQSTGELDSPECLVSIFLFVVGK